MSNLLSNPDAWEDFYGDTPPPYYVGDQIQVTMDPGGSSFELSLLDAPQPGDTFAATVVGTGFLPGIYLAFVYSGAQVAQWAMDGVERNIDMPAQSGKFILTNSGGTGVVTLYEGHLSMIPSPEQVSYNCECDDDDPVHPMQTLADLRKRLMIRLGYGAQADHPAAGMVLELNDYLTSAQVFMHEKIARAGFSIERFFRWPLVEGVRFYDIDGNDDSCPKKLDVNNITWVGMTRMGDPSTLRGEQWRPLICGINPILYSGGIQNTWPTHYEIRQCIEVWPAPGPDAGFLRIKGHFGLARFTEDTDKTTIDPEMVFLMALSLGKAQRKQQDAQLYQSMAMSRLRDLIARSHFTKRYIPGSLPRPIPPIPVLIGGYIPPGN